jgi:hypothetical protein
MFKNPISLLKEKITQYLHLKFELIRLEIIERMVNVMGYFAFIMIAIFLTFTFSLFVFFAIAETLKVLFNSYVYGYLATAGIILVICIITGMLSKKIIRFFAGKMAELLTKTYHSEEIDEAAEEAANI